MLLFTIFIIYWGHRCILNYPAGDLHSIKGAIGEPLRSPWEALGGGLGEPLGALGEPLGALWEPLGALRELLRALGELLGALGELLGIELLEALGDRALGGPLGSHWGDIG
jgi:hypothetical protein